LVGFCGGNAGGRVAVLGVQGDAGGAVGVDGEEAADAVPEGGGAEGVFLWRGSQWCGLRREGRGNRRREGRGNRRREDKGEMIRESGGD